MSASRWVPVSIVLASALTGGSSCGLAIFQFGAGADGNGAIFSQPWAMGMVVWAGVWPLGIAIGIAAAEGFRGRAALGLLAWLPGFVGLLFSGAPQRWLLESVRAKCDRDDGVSCHRLAEYHRRGRLVPRDDEAALTLERRSCRLGWVHGCLALVDLDARRFAEEACPAIVADCASKHPSHFCSRPEPACKTATP